MNSAPEKISPQLFREVRKGVSGSQEPPMLSAIAKTSISSINYILL